MDKIGFLKGLESKRFNIVTMLSALLVLNPDVDIQKYALLVVVGIVYIIGDTCRPSKETVKPKAAEEVPEVIGMQSAYSPHQY